MANFCAKCGNILPIDAKFCPNCGAQVLDTTKRYHPGDSANGSATTAKTGNTSKDVSRPIPPGSPIPEISEKSLDIFFYIPIGIFASMGVLTLMFIQSLMRIGRGEQGLFYFVLNIALAAVIWKWPYQEYKRGNQQKARKGVLIFAGVTLFFLLVSIGNGQMITAFFDMITLGSFAYLFYRLGGDSWSF